MMTYLFIILLTLSSCLHATPKYIRKDWHPRWQDADKDCQNTRAELLIARSHIPVTFKNNKKCVVVSGQWNDFYFNEMMTKASEVDIDHVVPLFEAHKSGGHKWTKNEKIKFSNDTENLVITSSTTNRKKGAHTLEKWLPLNLEYACAYYKKWMKIKNKYNLIITEGERNAVDISKCPSP